MKNKEVLKEFELDTSSFKLNLDTKNTKFVVERVEEEDESFFRIKILQRAINYDIEKEEYLIQALYKLDVDSKMQNKNLLEPYQNVEVTSGLGLTLLALAASGSVDLQEYSKDQSSQINQFKYHQYMNNYKLIAKHRGKAE